MRLIDDEAHFYKDGKFPDNYHHGLIPTKNTFIWDETEHGFGTFHSTTERFTPTIPSGMN